jgi:muramoyltetrapeptide carboxypeptidase
MRQTAFTTGTEYRLNATGKILFFEMFEQDANSIQYVLDALLFSGTFDGVVAIVFGDMLADFVHPDQVEWMLNRFAREEPKITVPVFRLHGIGHAFENYPLPFNTRAEIRLIDEDVYAMTVENVF